MPRPPALAAIILSSDRRTPESVTDSGDYVSTPTEKEPDMPETIRVPMKSATESKINWVQIAGVLASLAAFFGLNVDPATLASVIVGIQSAASLLTVVLKTWFTPTVTPASVGK